MPTATLSLPTYTIDHDPDNDVWYVLTAEGEAIDDGETRAEAEAAMARLMADDLRDAIRDRLDEADVATLRRMAALL